MKAMHVVYLSSLESSLYLLEQGSFSCGKTAAAYFVSETFQYEDRAV